MQGFRYYYKVQFVSGNTKIFSAPVSATVNKKLVKPVIKLKGTKTTYVITLKKSEGTKYQFQLRMKGYNGGRWFTTERYQGKLKKKIVMKKNQGSSSDFAFLGYRRMSVTFFLNPADRSMPGSYRWIPHIRQQSVEEISPLPASF